jgi:uncharacterized membrane protein YhaH (DUF805 family)
MTKFIIYSIVFSALCAIGVAFSAAGFTTSEVYQWREVVIAVSSMIFLTITMLVRRLSGLGASVIFVLISGILSALVLMGPGLNEPTGSYPADMVFFVYTILGVGMGFVCAVLLGVLEAARYDRKKRGC